MTCRSRTIGSCSHDTVSAATPGMIVRRLKSSSRLSVPVDRTSPSARPDCPVDERRVTPSEFKFPEGGAPGTGTSGVSGIRTVVLKGDPDGTGLYTIMLQVPAHTRIAPHDHQDDRIATVLTGTWFFGYGDAFDPAQLKALPPGSFYTEPANRTHFAETRDAPVILQITGVGPSSTRYVDSVTEPRRSP